jgi:tetratricopeptide (TPR) repeat protein
VHAARVLFGAGRAPAAAAVLAAGLPAATARWRDAHAPELATLWAGAKLEVPFGAPQVAAAMFAALQAREPARAEKLGRWAVALDPANAEAQRNLGLALAQQGKVADALVHLARGTREQATQILASVLSQRERLGEAIAVLTYASRWYTRAEQWLTYAAIAASAADTARTAHGYARAWELDPEAFDPAQLNAYGAVLDEIGDYDACARVAERLRASGGKQPVWLAAGAHLLACARVGQGRFDEAIALAEEAVAGNPLAESSATFTATLARATAGTPNPPRTAPAIADGRGRVREPVFAMIEAGEHAAAAAVVSRPLASWRVRRAALGAARVRTVAENAVAVTPRARGAAIATLADTLGLVDRDALIARVLALHVREQAFFARDPVPPLGECVTREAFHAELRARGASAGGAAPSSPAASPGFVDRVVVAGGKVARASDYIALLRDLAALDPREAIAQFSLDDESFLDVAYAWANALDGDATLAPLVAAGLARGATRS